MSLEIKLTLEDSHLDIIAQKVYDLQNNASEPEPSISLSDELLSVKEVARMVGLDKLTILSHIKNGLLEAKKVGKPYKITQEDFLKYSRNRNGK